MALARRFRSRSIICAKWQGTSKKKNSDGFGPAFFVASTRAKWQDAYEKKTSDGFGPTLFAARLWPGVCRSIDTQTSEGLEGLWMFL